MGSISPFGSRRMYTRRPVSSSVVAASAVDGSASEHEEERIFGPRTPQARSNGDLHEKAEDVLRFVTRTAYEEFPLPKSRRSCRGTSFGRRSGSDCRDRIRRRTRHMAANRGSLLSLSPRLSSFAVLLFILTFYVHNCLNKGFSELSSPLLLSRHTRKRTGEKPQFLDGRGPIRRLAGERFPHVPSHIKRKRDAAEEALCSAIEASAEARRAAAPQTVAEESSEEIQLQPSNPPASMEKGEGLERQMQGNLKFLADAKRAVFFFV